MAPLVPLALRLAGKRCVVVGGGTVALRRVNALLEGEAHITVVAPQVSAGLHSLAESGRIRIVPETYSPDMLTGVFLVIVATNDGALNARIAHDGALAGCLVNDADEPERGDCVFPATVRRGQLVISVTTGGASPTLTGQIRNEIESHFGSEYESYVRLLGEARAEVQLRIPGRVERKAVLNAIAAEPEILNLIRAGKPGEARDKAFACISSSLDSTTEPPQSS